MTKKKAGRYTPPKVRADKIRLLGDPALRATSSPVETFDSAIQDVVERLRNTLIESKGGAAVAAPQIGVNLNIFVWAEGAPVINPRIVTSSDELWDFREGCLSMPDMWFDLARPRYIDVEYQDELGNLRRVPQMEDFQTRVFQHEIDHLNGVLLLERLTDSEREDALRRLAAKGLVDPWYDAPSQDVKTRSEKLDPTVPSTRNV
jgi:peptide deformylase